ncbi:MAG: hypothetical protein COV67_14330 [Nitrospinae bacterium CG11_big_fil_rev_8_21_14_0_20_56_8]|nr:MAG: hypothetical protein COV67_14330 [Nitrospinae bacterium CG11_big_fil_rev_8_21_14_0_20_56_8]
MTLRFIFYTVLACLIVSGVAGWVFFGEREPDPQEKALEAYQLILLSERRSAEKGDVEDWTRYANSLVHGPADLRDPKAAMVWYRKAADEGYAPAQVGIGDLYSKGLGVQKNNHRAQEWYKLATRLSRNAEAYFKVGEGYFRGLGEPQDYGTALSYYKTAAKLGHPVAQYLIGSMYEVGWGVDSDLIEAWVWYMRALPKAEVVASYQEDFDVQKALNRLARHMNQSQLDVAAKRLANLPQ